MSDGRPYPNLGHAVLMTVAVVVLQVSLSVPIEVLGMVVGHALGCGPLHLTAHPVSLAVVNTIVFAVILLWGKTANRAPLRELFPLRPVRVGLLLPVVLTMLGASALLSEADNLFRWLWPMPAWLARILGDVLGAQDHPWSSFMVLVVVAPVTEELLYRGLILRGLLAHYRPGLAVLACAILFGLVHANPWQFVSATLLGALFGWWFLRTGSLLPCLVGHASHNSMVLFCQYLPFEIPGFNQGDPMTATGFQPWWFNLGGLAVAAAGCWLFHCLAPKPLAAPPVMPPTPPPLLSPPPLLASVQDRPVGPPAEKLTGLE
jgi:hypothetical protein